MNHTMGDGTSFWNFFNAWSEIFQARESNKAEALCLKNPPVLNRYIPHGYGPLYSLPYSHPDEFIRRYESPVLNERIFCFSSEKIRMLKAKVNKMCGTTSKISSLQSLTAVIWRCITRARRLPSNKKQAVDSLLTTEEGCIHHFPVITLEIASLL